MQSDSGVNPLFLPEAMGRPLLSLVVLTYNTRDLVVQCLESFYEQAVSWGWQVIVVDNGSTDDTASVLIEKFPGVELIRSEKNLGFAGGMNLGLRVATGRVIVLMNSDVLASAETLKAAAEALLSTEGAGALSPLLRMPDGRPQPFAFGKAQLKVYCGLQNRRSGFGPGEQKCP